MDFGHIEAIRQGKRMTKNETMKSKFEATLGLSGATRIARSPQTRRLRHRVFERFERSGSTRNVAVDQVA